MTLFAMTIAVVSVFAAPGTVPVIYTTDLYHPHNDPDDHYDLMTLYAMPEFDLRAIVIDMGEAGKGRPGTVALEQMTALTGRKVPYATGLAANLQSKEDTVANAPEAEQAGVRLILDTLHAAAQPVTVITAGSLRDVAAAYNREPALFREKVARLYVNAGWMGTTQEWNVGLDIHAYVRILESDLPVYWAPCFGEDRYQTYWKFRQGDLLADQRAPLQNFFLYMLTKTPRDKGDPIAYLYQPVDKAAAATFYPQERNMWCTATFLHAAGRPFSSFDFVATPTHIGGDGMTVPAKEGDAAARVLKTFRVLDAAAYEGQMKNALKALFSGMTCNAK